MRGTRMQVLQAVALAVVGMVLAAVGLALHAPPIALGDANFVDWLGTFVGLAGLVLVGLAFRLALRGRSLLWKLAAVPVVVLLLLFYALPVIIAGLVGNADRFYVDAANTLGLAGARDVRFAARDGVELAGWYVPGRRDADIVLAHGYHGSRKAVQRHLRLLARLGYGVLAFDARGHGESECGSVNVARSMEPATVVRERERAQRRCRDRARRSDRALSRCARERDHRRTPRT